MGSIGNTVDYCCVWNGGRVLYAYNGGGGQETETLAALCLEKAPCHHKWYFQTMLRKTFGFLMEDGYVYFAIIDESLGNPGSLRFLERVRDEFKKVAKKGSKRSMSNPNSLVLQERLLPVIRRLITSLEHVAETKDNHNSESNGHIDMGVSTKAPLLGKHSKQEKRKTRDHVIAVREHRVSEEHTKSEAVKIESKTQSGSVEAMSGLMRNRSTGQSLWCRQVRIVLAVDVAICLILFVVWMVVCRGTKCIR